MHSRPSRSPSLFKIEHLCAIACPVLAGLTAMYAVSVAWCCDDAYITFRSVHRVIAGDGITWNAGERLQAFSHPLWFWLVTLIYGITAEMYFSVTALSLVLALTSFVCIAYLPARSRRESAVALAVIACSQCLTDFSTSGLENPLSLFLIAMLVLSSIGVLPNGWNFRRALPYAAAMLVFTRIDYAVLVAPLLLCDLWLSPGKIDWVKRCAMAFLPLTLWWCFSSWYFAYPFPNTALAKIDPRIPLTANVTQGLRYLWLSLRTDPALAVCLPVGVLALFLDSRRHMRALAAGIVLYLIGVIFAGGDFMTGRFFSVPFLASLAGVLSVSGRSRHIPAPFIGLVAALSLLSVHTPLGLSLRKAKGTFAVDREHGFVNERQFYFAYSGLPNVLLAERKDLSVPHHHCSPDGPGPVQAMVNVGFAGWNACPDTIIVDVAALADPFLSRLPPEPGYYQPGHLYRRVPEGYIESRQLGDNLLSSAPLRLLYDKLSFALRGPLFNWERTKTALALSLGRYDYLIREHRGRYR